MGHNKIVFLVTTGLLLISGVFFYTVHENAEEYQEGVSSEVEVEQTWELPDDLKEISGIAFLEPNLLACVQDEKGVIFIYNLETSAIERQIKFSGSGDYEAIAVNGNTAYVQVADGLIFRINDFMDKNASVDKFKTPFSSKNNIESLFFDPVSKSLLLIPKERGLDSKEANGIYAVDVQTMKMKNKPILELDFKEEIFESLREREKDRLFYPSDLVRDPKSGNYLILEAEMPHLLILDKKGKPQTLHRLDPNIFPQPEGLAFDNAGNLYISSEGNPATIQRVSFKKKK
ncbi:SdiA-regulated domain-containing protein [Salinimicrobium oceani]|uniref:SdiA-regulated n=1 Tax=Salinimicrobium oceani TaxID=2722702 RepID=A0ABX1D3W5_9FLAO|nr:SdiA-regulated domain-containing protein [Salinimicrobium oceani]NJW53216.1 hypothetical protein [Salinimicrobium oceani]